MATRWQITENAPYINILNESGETPKNFLSLIICILSDKLDSIIIIQQDKSIFNVKFEEKYADFSKKALYFFL